MTAMALVALGFGFFAVSNQIRHFVKAKDERHDTYFWSTYSPMKTASDPFKQLRKEGN